VQHDDCEKNVYPLVYGTALVGAPFEINGQKQHGLPAKALQAGQVYDVEIEGPVRGHGRFRVLADGGVDNLPWTFINDAAASSGAHP